MYSAVCLSTASHVNCELCNSKRHDVTSTSFMMVHIYRYEAHTFLRMRVRRNGWPAGRAAQSLPIIRSEAVKIRKKTLLNIRWVATSTKDQQQPS